MKKSNKSVFKSTNVKFPRMIELGTSNLCNLRCKTCIRGWKEYKQESPIFLTYENFKVLISRFPKLEKLQICGFSEPTLNKDVPMMIKYAKQSGIGFVEMFTNGTLLKGQIAEEISKSGLDLLRVSIDGADYKTYKYMRGADLNKVIENVRQFTAVSTIPVRMESVLSKDTYQSANKLPGLAHSIRAKVLSIRLLDGQDYDVSNNSVYEEGKLIKLKSNLEKECEAYKIKLVMVLPHEEKFVSRCTAWDEIYINEKCELVPCYLLKDMSVGNLLEYSFEELVKKYKKEFLESMDNNDGFLDKCCCNYALLIRKKVNVKN